MQLGTTLNFNMKMQPAQAAHTRTSNVSSWTKQITPKAFSLGCDLRQEEMFQDFLVQYKDLGTTLDFKPCGYIAQEPTETSNKRTLFTYIPSTHQPKKEKNRILTNP